MLKQKPKRKNRQWSQEDVNTALERLKKGELSLRRASKLYNVPKTTLGDKLNHRSPVVTREGRVPYLTAEEETAITKWTIHMDRLGFGPTRKDIQEVVKQILDKDGRYTPFKDNRPGSKWFARFIGRNPGAVVRKDKPDWRKKIAVPPSVMDTWFDDFVKYLEEIKAEAILNEPTRLFKCEESTFELDDLSAPMKLKRTKATMVSKVRPPKYTQVTALLAVSADGRVPPPLIVLPSKKTLGPRSRMDGAPKGAVLAGTQDGVMNASAFLEFLKNIFQPFLIQKQVPGPVLLFVNEHSKCQSLEVSSFCKENDILLYQGPPYAAYECQLSKLFIAECLKVDWGFIEKAHKVHNPGCHVTKKSLPAIIYEAWQKLQGRPSVGIDEFKAIGVYPFTKVYKPSRSKPSTSKPSTASTSKESLPPGNDDSDAAPSLGPSAHPSIEDEIEAAVSSLMSAMSPETSASASAMVTIPGKAPIQVSPTTTMLLSKVVGVLEQNGDVTFHTGKRPQEDGVLSSQGEGSRKGKKQRQVPEELWDEFLRFMAKKKKKIEEKKAMKNREWESALKEKRLKKEKALQKALREKEKKKEMSERRGEKRKHVDESGEEESIKRKQERSKTKKRGGKVRRKTLRRDDDDSDSNDDSNDDDDSDSVSDSEDSSDAGDDENICIECDQGGDESGWIGCNSCTSWLHLDCSELCGMTLGEVEEIPYKCKYCQ